MIASLIIGVIIGISSGYYGGKIDAFFSWLITVFWSVPTLLIALGLSMVFGKGYYQVLLATALSTWVEVARVVRGQTLQLKQREFILAAKLPVSQTPESCSNTFCRTSKAHSRSWQPPTSPQPYCSRLDWDSSASALLHQRPLGA